jgi:hypothetical protein
MQIMCHDCLIDAMHREAETSGNEEIVVRSTQGLQVQYVEKITSTYEDEHGDPYDMSDGPYWLIPRAVVVTNGVSLCVHHLIEHGARVAPPVRR